MKTCTKCKIQKNESDFTKKSASKDGLSYWCKDCYDEYKVLYRKKNIEKIRESGLKSYYKMKENSPDKYRASKKRAHKNYRKNHPERVLAHSAVWNAVNIGQIKKEPCCFCGDTNVQAHHEDYSRPLNVIWVCKKHHNEIHNK